jgi:hypothetical protein
LCSGMGDQMTTLTEELDSSLFRASLANAVETVPATPAPGYIFQNLPASR